MPWLNALGKIKLYLHKFAYTADIEQNTQEQKEDGKRWPKNCSTIKRLVAPWNTDLVPIEEKEKLTEDPLT